jgi:lipid II:glycine glycyltransferase (peptidoglycan interpeptide bridge formation enzyme)
LIQQEARLRQLHNAFRVTQLHRYLTQPVLDYLRTENAFEYWAKEAAAFAKKTSAVDLVVDPELNVADLLVKYLDKQGITPDTDFFEWMEELGQGDFTQFYEPLIKASLAEKGKPDG